MLQRTCCQFHFNRGHRRSGNFRRFCERQGLHHRRHFGQRFACLPRQWLSTAFASRSSGHMTTQVAKRLRKQQQKNKKKRTRNGSIYILMYKLPLSTCGVQVIVYQGGFFTMTREHTQSNFAQTSVTAEFAIRSRRYGWVYCVQG